MIDIRRVQDLFFFTELFGDFKILCVHRLTNSILICATRDHILGVCHIPFPDNINPSHTLHRMVDLYRETYEQAVTRGYLYIHVAGMGLCLLCDTEKSLFQCNKQCQYRFCYECCLMMVKKSYRIIGSAVEESFIFEEQRMDVISCPGCRTGVIWSKYRLC